MGLSDIYSWDSGFIFSSQSKSHSSGLNVLPKHHVKSPVMSTSCYYTWWRWRLPAFSTVKLLVSSLIWIPLWWDGWRWRKYSVYHQILPNFNIHRWFLLGWVLIVLVAEGECLIPSILLHLLVHALPSGRFSILLHLLICIFMPKFMCGFLFYFIILH